MPIDNVNQNSSAFPENYKLAETEMSEAEPEQASVDINEKSPDELSGDLVKLVCDRVVEQEREYTTEERIAEISRLAKEPLLVAIKEQKVNIDNHAMLALKKKDYVLAQVLFNAGANAQWVATQLIKPFNWEEGGIEALSKLLNKNTDIDLGEKIDPPTYLAQLSFVINEELPGRSSGAVAFLINSLSAEKGQDEKDIDALYRAATFGGFVDAIASYAERHGQTRFVDKLFRQVDHPEKIVGEYFESLCTRARAKGDEVFAKVLSKFGETYADALFKCRDGYDKGIKNYEEQRRKNVKEQEQQKKQNPRLHIRRSSSYLEEKGIVEPDRQFIQQANKQIIGHVKKSLNKKGNVADALVPFLLAVERGWIAPTETAAIPLLTKHLPIETEQLQSAQEQKTAEAIETLYKVVDKAVESSYGLIKAAIIDALEHEQPEVAYKFSQYTNKLREVYNVCMEYVRTLLSENAIAIQTEGIFGASVKAIRAKFSSIFEILETIFARLGLSSSSNFLDALSERKESEAQEVAPDKQPRDIRHIASAA